MLRGWFFNYPFLKSMKRRWCVFVKRTKLNFARKAQSSLHATAFARQEIVWIHKSNRIKVQKLNTSNSWRGTFKVIIFRFVFQLFRVSVIDSSKVSSSNSKSEPLHYLCRYHEGFSIEFIEVFSPSLFAYSCKLCDIRWKMSPEPLGVLNWK